MKTKQFIWEDGWQSYDEKENFDAELVIFFGGSTEDFANNRYKELAEKFSTAQIIGCTTAGEIIGDEVLEDGASAVAIQFEKTEFKGSALTITNTDESYKAGLEIGNQLKTDDLKVLFVLSDGNIVNGDELVKGLREVVSDEVSITGGLAGDGGAFQKTFVCYNGEAIAGQIAAIGLYGDAIKIGFGSVGGWDAFGPMRSVTKSTSNVLYELDGKPALELYKSYLGDEAENLPGSALQFPIMIRPSGQEGTGTVRTILSVDEENQSLTFAGDIPEGYEAQLMMASFEHLVNGAGAAAEHAVASEVSNIEEGDKLALLVSCVGRKMVLGQRTEDEVEAVVDTLDDNTAILGFYSYGEICPHEEMGFCHLHNQTMTITYLAEEV